MTFHQDIGFQPAQTNPFAILPSIQALREIQGQNALGAAYRSAVDPTTGQIDQAKLANALAASNAPWMVGPGGIQAGQSMEAQGAGTQAQLETNWKQLDYMNGVTGQILRDHPTGPITSDMLQPYFKTALQSGAITPQYYQQQQTVLGNAHPGEDLRPLVTAQQYATQSAQAKLATLLPNYTGVDTGGQYTQIQSNPNLPGYGLPVQAIPKTPGPESTTDVVITSGPHAGQVIHNVPTALATSIGTTNLFRVLGGDQGGIANPQINIGTGRIRPTGQGDGGGGAAAAPGVAVPPPKPAPPSQAPTVGMSLPPGQATAFDVSAKDYAEARNQAETASSRILTAQQGLTALQGAVTGPGTDFVSNVNGLLGSFQANMPGWLSRQLTGAGLDPQGKAVNRDEANKYLMQIAIGQAANLGHNTDQQLASAITGNPSTHIQNLAAQNILHVQIGLERYTQMMWQQARAQGVTPGNFADWKADWTLNHDPRAFILDQIPEDQLERLKTELKQNPAQMRRFVQTVQEGASANYIQNPFRTSP